MRDLVSHVRSFITEIKKFVRTARRYRTVQIRAGKQTRTASTQYPTTSARPSPTSTHRAVRTDLAEVGSRQELCRNAEPTLLASGTVPLISSGWSGRTE